MNISRHSLHLIPILALLWALPLAVSAQKKGAEYDQGKTSQGAAIQASSTLVRFNIQVRTPKGNLVTGLSPANFQVFEDGKPQLIRFFAPDSAPVSIAVLTEFSRVTPAIIPEVRNAIGLLVTHLNPADYCALVAFNDRPEIIADFSRDRRTLMRKTAGLQFTIRSGIRLFTSLQDLLTRMESLDGKKGIVLLATGMNSAGSSLNRLRPLLQTAGVPVYTISMGQHSRNRRDPFFSEADHQNLFRADHTLRQIAEYSGGMAFFPTHPKAFPEVMQTVLIYLHHQYLIAYPPPDPDQLKRHRKVTITASADLDHDGRPDPLEVVYVREYTLASRRHGQ